MIVQTLLEKQISTYGSFGHPALFERFVLAKGREHGSQALPMKYSRGQPKTCFMNSSRLAMADPGLTYVEGFACLDSIPEMLFHHAWVVDGCGRVLDPTWEDPQFARYYGVEIDRITLVQQQLVTQCFSPLDNGVTLNWKWLFKQMPELQALAKEMRTRRSQNV